MIYSPENLVLFTDMDGTLLPKNKELNPVDLEAIEAFRRAGGLYSIATGRTLQAMEGYLAHLTPDLPIILFNGSATYDTVKKDWHYNVNLVEEARTLVGQVLDEFPDVSAEILRTDGTYVARMTPIEEEHLRICRVEPVMMPLSEIPTGWLKVLFTIAPERMDDLMQYLAQRNIAYADFIRSDLPFYEMLPKNSSKGSAMHRLRQMNPGRQVVAMGDYQNDIEMLIEADLGVCPANATPEAMAAADYTLAGTSDEGAVAELIDKLLHGYDFPESAR